MQLLREKFINLEIKRSFKVITNYLDKLGSFDYYSSHPQNFISYLKNFIHDVEQNIDAIPNNNLYRSNLLSFLNDDFIQVLRYIQRSQTRHIPWSLISNIEQLMAELKLSDYTIILRPQWHWNYTILIKEELISLLAKKIDTLTNGEKIIRNEQKVQIISFPILERTNFLLHTIIGHEIGHFIQEEYFKEDQNKIRKQEQHKYIQKKLTQQNNNIKEEQLIEDVTQIQDIYEGMIREIIPDIIGYRLFGPSILCSSVFLTFWNKDLDTPSLNNDYYPPLRYRIRILFNFLLEDLSNLDNSKSESKSRLLNFKDSIKEYLSREEDIKLLSKSPIVNEAYQLFEQNKTSIIDYCQERVPKKYIVDFSKLDYLLNRIKNVIPPNEYKGNPVNLSDIFLSGWIYYYNDLVNNKDYDKNDASYIINYTTLNKLLLHAANLIYVQKEYNKNVNPK